MTGKRTLERSIVRQLDAWLTDENNWTHADIDNTSGICEMPFRFKSDCGRYEIEGTAQSKLHYVSDDCARECGAEHVSGEWEMDEVLWYEIGEVFYYGEKIEI